MELIFCNKKEYINIKEIKDNIILNKDERNILPNIIYELKEEKNEKNILENLKNSRNDIKIENEDLIMINQEIIWIKNKLENFHKNEILYNQIKQLADSRIQFLKNQRRFDKIWLHLNMNSILNLDGSNYLKFKDENKKIMNILEKYDYLLEMNGLNEAYIDLTYFCQKNKIYTKNGIISVVNEIKNKISNETNLSFFYGIGCNKTLAKLCSTYNNEHNDGIYFLDYEENIIIDFVSKLSIGNIPYIGDKLKLKLNLLNIYTFKDLYEKYIDLFYLNEEKFDFYMKIIFGIGDYEHFEYQQEKYISRSEAFYLTENQKYIFKIFENLKEKIFKDMDKNNILICKTLTIEIIGYTETKIIKSFTNKFGFPNKRKIDDKCDELFIELLEREPKIRMIRIKLSGLIKERKQNNEGIIFELLDNLKNDYQEGILPKKNFLLTSNNNNNNIDKRKKIINDLNKKIKIFKNRTKIKIRNKLKKFENKYYKKREKRKLKSNIINKSFNKYFDILNLVSNMKQDKIKIKENI